jgi:hypothetical protein
VPCEYGRVRSRAIIVVAVMALVVATVPSFAAAPTVVLGSRAFAPHGSGWGTAHPDEIFNGGDPSGLVSHIRWSRWGGPSASGQGENAIFRPHGGYYRQLVSIELRATDRGRCSETGPLAYRQLYAREPSRPGGRFGKWFLWSGSKTICRLSP